MNWGKAQAIALVEQMNPQVATTRIVLEGKYYVVVVYYKDGSVRTRHS